MIFKQTLQGSGIQTFSLIILFVLGVFSVGAQPRADIDSSFAEDGWLVLPWAKQNITVNSMLVQPDGKFVVAGRYNVSDVVTSFCLMRMMPDGTPDTDFGDEGLVITPIDSFFDNGRNVVMDKEGNLYLAGSTGMGEVSDWVIVKYLDNGRLDEGFGNKGMLIGDLEGYDYAIKLAIARDGLIAIVNTTVDETDFVVIKRDFTGKPDTDFGDKGSVQIDLGANDYATDIEIDDAGNIIIGGSTAEQFTWNSFFVRLTSDGAFDKTFSEDGIFIYTISEYGDQLRDIVLYQDGSILACGNAYDENRDQDFTLVRLNADGTPDTGFGEEGVTITKVSEGFDATQNVILFEDGSILVCGYAWQEEGDYKLTAYKSDGAIDEDFASGGLVSLDYNNSDEVPLHMVLAPDNSIYILGGFFSQNRSIPLLTKLISGYEVSVSPIRNTGDISVFPNPANRTVQIELGQQNVSSISIRLVDLQGREVASTNINSVNAVLSYELPAGLNNGLYQLIVTSEKGIWSTPIIKE